MSWKTTNVGILMTLACGCGVTPGSAALTQYDALDWQDMLARATITLDVGDDTLSGAQLEQKYATEEQDAYVRRVSSGRRSLLLVDVDTGAQHLYFPGANLGNPSDLIADLDARPVLDSQLGVMLHQGFRWAANEAVASLDGMLDREYPVTITGYSLGGAIAAVAGAKLAASGYSVTSVLTFGQPPVTGAAGAMRLSRMPMIRCITRGDWAPMLFADDYAHFGHALVLYDGAEYAYLRMDDPYFALSTDPEAVMAKFQQHYEYLPQLALKVRQAEQVPYRLAP